MNRQPFRHTPGPWELVDDQYLRPASFSQSRNVARIAELNNARVYRHPDNQWEEEIAANRRLITQAPALFDFVVKMHRHLLAERDCFYEGCSMANGNIPHIDDRECLAAIDADIDEAQALLDAVAGGEHADEV